MRPSARNAWWSAERTNRPRATCGKGAAARAYRSAGRASTRRHRRSRTRPGPRQTKPRADAGLRRRPRRRRSSSAWRGSARPGARAARGRTPASARSRAAAARNPSRKVIRLRGPARHHQVADRDLHGLALLVARSRAHLDESLVRPRLRRPHLEHLGFHGELVARPHGQRPAEFVEAGADDAPGRLEVALHQEAHGHRRGVPAARGKPAEDRAPRGLLVLVERLRIEFRREAFDALALDAQAPRAVFLSGCEVLEIPHAGLLCSVGQASGPNPAPAAMAAALMRAKAASARLCATKTSASSPVQASASHPKTAAIASRVRLPISGQSSRPAPCDAKYSASARPNMPQNGPTTRR